MADHRASIRRYFVFAVLAPFVFLALTDRAATSASQAAQPMTNIYEPQYQST